MPTQTGSIDLKSIKKAYEAETIAGDTNQYFWFRSTGSDTGAHITEIPQDLFLNNPTGGNVLVRSNGLAIRKGLTEIATFSADGIQLGVDGVVEISPTGATPVPVQASYNYPYTIDLSTGNEVQVDLSEVPFFSQLSAGIAFRFVWEINGGSSYDTFFYKGEQDIHYMGMFDVAYDGDVTLSIYPYGVYGQWSNTSIRCYTSYTTEGAYFALGKRSGAVGRFSGSFGEGLIASGDDQLVVGTYNEEDSTKAIIVGNGTLNGTVENRSNAFTVSKDGNVEIALDDTAATGTTDGDLYKAITSMGWEGDVIV